MREVLFEFIRHGKFVKVCAIEPETGIEVQVIGDATYPTSYLEKIAVQKLKKVIQKHQSKFFSLENQNKY